MSESEPPMPESYEPQVDETGTPGPGSGGDGLPPKTGTETLRPDEDSRDAGMEGEGGDLGHDPGGMLGEAGDHGPEDAGGMLGEG